MAIRPKLLINILGIFDILEQFYSPKRAEEVCHNAGHLYRKPVSTANQYRLPERALRPLQTGLLPGHRFSFVVNKFA